MEQKTSILYKRLYLLAPIEHPLAYLCGGIPITERVAANHFRRQYATLHVEKTKGFCPR